MIFRTIGLVVVISVAGLALPVRAGISAFWMPVASGDGSVGTMYPAAAIADDPQLANMQTWDLMVTTSGDWASAGVRAIFEPIEIARWYHHALAGDTRPDPALVAAHPAAAYDTFVTAPADDGVTGAPNIFGGHPTGPVPNFGGAVGEFSVAWGHGTTVVDPPGTYQIARWTFPLGPVPRVVWFGDPPTLPAASHTSQINPDSNAIIPQIPEPASVGMWVALAVGAHLAATRSLHGLQSRWNLRN